MIPRTTWPFLLSAVLACATATGDRADAGDGKQDDSGGSDGSPIDPSCPKEPCDLIQQCGCESSSACDLADATGATSCRAITAEGMEESNCSAASQCAAGYSCLSGQCRRYCANDLHCGAGYCLLSVTSGGEPIPGATVCTKTCKPEAASGNGCPTSPQYNCHLFFHDPDGSLSSASPARSGDEYWLSDCVRPPATGGGDETRCETGGASACAPGFMCVALTGGELGNRRACKRTCVVESCPGPSCECGAGTECRQFPDDPTGPTPPAMNLVEYGVCLQAP